MLLHIVLACWVSVLLSNKWPFAITFSENGGRVYDCGFRGCMMNILTRLWIQYVNCLIELYFSWQVLTRFSWGSSACIHVCISNITSFHKQQLDCIMHYVPASPLTVHAHSTTHYWSHFRHHDLCSWNELPRLWTFIGLNFSLCFCCRFSKRSYDPRKFHQRSMFRILYIHV